MADPTQDYTNKGSLWPSKGFRGKLDIGGGTYYVLMVATMSQNERAPTYKAIVNAQGEIQESVIPVWRDSKPENKRVGYFEYADHYVSVFVNAPREGGSPNAPVLGLSAHPKDMPLAPPQPPPAAPDPFDGLPF